MQRSLPGTIAHSFLGQAPRWYKAVICLFLLLNPLVLATLGPVATGWLLVIQFIFTLGMALKCYPLMPGGLLLIEALLLKLTTAQALYDELLHNFPVILLLMFMVAGIHFMKELLLFLFSKILLGVHSKTVLALLFCVLSAILSAFLDALTVTAVIIVPQSAFMRCITGSLPVPIRVKTRSWAATSRSPTYTAKTLTSSAPFCVACSCTALSAPRWAASARWSASRRTC